jgi:hypothetical protein
MDRQLTRRVFFALAILTIAIALYSYLHRFEMFRPDPCTCRDVFSGDSSLAMHAARRVVGNGYYVFTIPAGKEACASAYVDEYHTNDRKFVMDSMQCLLLKNFFDSSCSR